MRGFVVAWMAGCAAKSGPAPAAGECAPLAPGAWSACDGQEVTARGRIAEIPHAHPISVGPDGGVPVYVDVPEVGQIVAVAASDPGCTGDVEVRGRLRRVELGGEPGTRGSYAGWAIDGATLTCPPG